MTAQHEFYLERAKEARATARAATLDNVRDRCLRSEAGFLAMAERQDLADRNRARREAAAAALAEENAATEQAEDTTLPEQVSASA